MPFIIPKDDKSPVITVTLDELAQAIDNLRLTPILSAELLHLSILQVRGIPPTTQPQISITPAASKSNSRFIYANIKYVCVIFRDHGAF